MKQELDWYGNKDLKLIWKENGIDLLNQYIGRKIINIHIIESLLRSYKLETNEMILSESVLNGIGFEFEGKFLSVYNAFDQIGLEYSKNENDRYISLKEYS